MKKQVTFEDKLHFLKKQLSAYSRMAIAFSGGKDSFFLLEAAVTTLGAKNVQAFFVTTSFTSPLILKRLLRLRRRLPFRLRKFRLDLLASDVMKENPRDRCYHCKKKMFTMFYAEARRMGISCLADGTTRSDEGEYRPGRRALQELGVISPLKDAGISSKETAEALRKSGLCEDILFPTTCLATRFPYGHRLNAEEISRIGAMETFLQEKGIVPLRVRHLAEGIRIETSPDHLPSLLKLRQSIVRRGRSLGWRFITLDLEGLRSGCWDETNPLPSKSSS